MLKLYLLLGLMLIIALTILAFPFIKKRAIHFIFVACIFSLFVFSIYQFSGNKKALSSWLSRGQEHYNLQEQFNALGGVDGVIKRIEKKLEANPQDAEGWFILGKLYMAKREYPAAKAALQNAHDLSPNNPDISRQYEALVSARGS